MSKNKQSVAYGALNGVLVLFAQQVASGQYPIEEPAKSIITGVLALAVCFVTALSPFFDVRQTRK